jgi:hypothetical protein
LDINNAELSPLLKAVDGRYGFIAFFRTDSGAIGQSLGLYGEWAEQELSFIRRFVEPGATVLDVGAYIGTHTLAFAQYVGQTGAVSRTHALATSRVKCLNVPLCPPDLT